MHVLLIIFYIFCASFFIMYMLTVFAPEYIEDEFGNLIRRKKKFTETKEAKI
jgi:hypothetical protein